MSKDESGAGERPSCFIIMPISDCDGYSEGHFRRVYHDIIKPACEIAGVVPTRADDIAQTNLIQIDILDRLISADIAICDLSSHNANVLFELGIRQAFDKPTVLIQERGTKPIFDIAPLRYTNYRPDIKYREALEDQRAIAEAIDATMQEKAKGKGVNSLVSLLSVVAGPATIKESDGIDIGMAFSLLRDELTGIKAEVRDIRASRWGAAPAGEIARAPVSALNTLMEASKILDRANETLSLELKLDLLSKAQSLLLPINPDTLPARYQERLSMLITRQAEMESLAISLIGRAADVEERVGFRKRVRPKYEAVQDKDNEQ